MKINVLNMIFWLILIFSVKSFAQNEQRNKHRVRLGFNTGFGIQESFPFNSPDYLYDVQFYKFQINYLVIPRSKWNFELNLEPSYYRVEHQLLNKYYVRPEEYDDYLDKREEFTKKKNINEYVLNIGLLARYSFCKSMSVYALGSVGPMYSDTDTERMSAGFAFSDIFGLGMSYQIKRFLLDFRYSIRHVSNANIRKPNNGYNSSNIEIGCTYQL
jgi:hypothetical protein